MASKQSCFVIDGAKCTQGCFHCAMYYPHLLSKRTGGPVVAIVDVIPAHLMDEAEKAAGRDCGAISIATS